MGTGRRPGARGACALCESKSRLQLVLAVEAAEHVRGPLARHVAIEEDRGELL